MLSTKKTYAPNMDSKTKIKEEIIISQPKSTKASTNKTLRFASNPTTYHYTHKKQSVCHPMDTASLSTIAIAEMPPEELKNYLAKIEAKQSLIAKLIFPKNF